MVTIFCIYKMTTKIYAFIILINLKKNYVYIYIFNFFFQILNGIDSE